MADGLSTGAAIIVGGVFVGSVIVYAVAKRKGLKLKLPSCINEKASAIAQTTSAVVSDAKVGFHEGFTSACHPRQTEAEVTA